jgi:hypothetical protein
MDSAASLDSNSEDDLTSPSICVRRKVGLKASQIEVCIPRAADNTFVESASHNLVLVRTHDRRKLMTGLSSPRLQTLLQILQ